MKTVYLSVIAALISAPAFASSYSETVLADCGTFQMLEVEVGTHTPDGQHVDEKYKTIRDAKGEEIHADWDKNGSVQFVTSSETSIIVELVTRPNGNAYITYDLNWDNEENVRDCTKP